MIYIFILIIIDAAVIRGIHESMVMTQDFDIMHTGEYPGVRGHDWFGRYHIISPGRDSAFIAIGYVLALLVFKIGFIPVVKIFPGMIFIFWEVTELIYAKTRGGKWIYYHRDKPYEHTNFFEISFFDREIYGKGVYKLHAFRILTGIPLLTGGLLL